jgi:GNAT superfamily N-acetyltransferase
MTNIQTLIVQPGTPQLAICARWRANAFSAHKASFEQELSSLELFASDQSHGVALVATADDEPIGTCLLLESEIEPNHDVSPWLPGLFVVPEHRRKGAGAVLVRAPRTKRDSESFRGCTSTPQRLSGSMRGSVGQSLIAPTGRASTQL